MRHISPLLLVLSLSTLPGCYRMMAMFNDTGGAGDGKEAAPAEETKRSYANPEMAATQKERADIEAMCSGIVSHDRKNTPRGKDIGTYKITAQSTWGAEMIKHLNQAGRHEVAPRLARLLRDEGMKWSTGDCRDVIHRYSSYN